jgi:secreted trypsin-like serine protease
MKVGLDVVALDSCNQTYLMERKFRSLPNYIQPSQICAGVPDGKNNSCQGNSGGPLQTIVNNQHHIVGVVSFGIACENALPSIYTRVSFYLDWIESIVWP